MNPAFVLLVLVGAVILWFLLSFIFWPLGKLVYRIIKDATDQMEREENNNENKEESKNE